MSQGKAKGIRKPPSPLAYHYNERPCDSEKILPKPMGSFICNPSHFCVFVINKQLKSLFK